MPWVVAVNGIAVIGTDDDHVDCHCRCTTRNSDYCWDPMLWEMIERSFVSLNSLHFVIDANSPYSKLVTLRWEWQNHETRIPIESMQVVLHQHLHFDSENDGDSLYSIHRLVVWKESYSTHSVLNSFSTMTYLETTSFSRSVLMTTVSLLVASCSVIQIDPSFPVCSYPYSEDGR